jgi:hypothetical protein
MKLTMALQDGVAILTGTGPVSAKDVQILRAGLAQLLKSGRNRVALVLPSEGDRIPPDLLREISTFDVLARELSGRIVLAGVSPAFRDQLSRFALPPVITCFETLEGAIRSFGSGPLDRGKEESKDGAGAPPVLVPPPVNSGDAVQRRLAQLETENALLREQLRTALLHRRQPATVEAQQAQVRALEGQIEDLMNYIQTIQKR